MSVHGLYYFIVSLNTYTTQLQALLFKVFSGSPKEIPLGEKTTQSTFPFSILNLLQYHDTGLLHKRGNSIQTCLISFIAMLNVFRDKKRDRVAAFFYYVTNVLLYSQACVIEKFCFLLLKAEIHVKLSDFFYSSQTYFKLCSQILTKKHCQKCLQQLML